jgi:hypothetical protein
VRGGHFSRTGGDFPVAQSSNRQPATDRETKAAGSTTMSNFDATGGPWGFRLRTPASGGLGVDVYIEANTFSNQPQPEFLGTIPDQTIYVGTMADGEVYLERHNWYNQGAQYRSVAANYPQYPAVTVVDYSNLYWVAPLLPTPELVISPAGEVNLTALLSLLNAPAVLASESLKRSTLALLSSCAATTAQRTQLGGALGLTGGKLDVLMDYGVVLHETAGVFSAADIDAVKATLGLFPTPVIDQLHLLVMDESTLMFAVYGGFTSGGVINSAGHASTLGGFVAYPNGGQVPSVNRLQILLTHEMGHMLDAASVGYETNRYTDIYNAGANDANAYLYQQVYPLRTEDIIFCWLGYCVDSQTILDAVAARGNAVLSRKLAHVIDMMPSLTPGTAPFFSTNPTSHVTTVTYVPVTRGPSMYLGDDGMIASVNGTTF